MGIKKALSTLAFKTKDKAPELYLVAGIIGFGVTIVLACKATTKVEEIIDEHKHNMDDINDTLSKCASSDPDYEEDEYTEDDAKKDKFIFTVKTGGALAKNYAPAIICGTLTITAFLASYKVLHGRYVAAATLAATLSETFAEYRKRVRLEVGDEREKELYYGEEHVKVSYDNGDGKVKKDVDIKVKTPNAMPPYAKCFDEANRQYNKSHSVNLMFLKGVENRLNDKFHENGYLLLNDVYRALDFNETVIGTQVGWFESHGDQFVDLGVRSLYDPNDIAEYGNGRAPGIWISPNCVPIRKGDLPEI